MAKALLYVSNLTLHIDFYIPYVNEVIEEKGKKYYKKITFYPKKIINPLKVNPKSRKPKKKWP